MNSTIVVPSAASIGATSSEVNAELALQGNYQGAIASALLTLATQAKADLDSTTANRTVVTPLGSAADDGPQITTALASGNVELVHGATYTLATTVVVPSNRSIFGNGATINQVVPAVDGVSGVSFFAARSQLGSNITLAANVTPWSYTFTTTTDPALSGCVVNGYVTLAETVVNAAQSYKIKNITGSSNPWTVTVERPILLPFLAVSAVAYASSQPVRLGISKLTINATSGDRVIEFSGVQGCLIEFVDIVSSGTGIASFAAAFDAGSYLCVMRNVTVDGGATATMGLALESCEKCLLDHCAVSNISAAGSQGGIYAYSARDCEIRSCTARGCDYGLLLDLGGTTVYPSDLCRVVGGSYNSNRLAGILIADGGDGWELVGVSANRNTGYGLLLANIGGSAPARTTVVGSTFNNNTSHGIDISAGTQTSIVGCETTLNGVNGVTVETLATKTLISGHKADSNVGYGIVAHADAAIVGYRGNENGTGGSGGALQVDSTALVILDGFDFGATFNGDCHMIDASGSVGIRASNGRIKSSGTGNKFAFIRNTSTGVDSLTSVSGNCTFGYYNNGGAAAGSALRLGPGCDFSGSATPMTVGGNERVDFGTVTLNGATGVDVLYNAILATDHVLLTRKTSGGTPGAAPTFTITAGSKFTVFGTALDTSVYDYKIVRQ